MFAPSLFLLDSLQQVLHVSPKFLAHFLLVCRQIGDGGRVADAGQVGVFLPVLKRLADAVVFLDVVGELGTSGGGQRVLAYCGNKLLRVLFVQFLQ
jgi:hypothetical protein